MYLNNKVYLFLTNLYSENSKNDFSLYHWISIVPQFEIGCNKDLKSFYCKSFFGNCRQPFKIVLFYIDFNFNF